MDNINGKMTKIEWQMALDDMENMLPEIIKYNEVQAKVSKAKFDSLIEAGFTEMQALKICAEKMA